MFWGLSGLRRNNSWSFSICHGSESGGNVSASEVCSEVGCRISTCVDLCHQVRHHQTQLHYHHHNHHLSIEMTCQWQVYVVSLHSLQMAQTCSSHTSSCLLELMSSQGLRRGRLPPPDTWGIGEEMGRLFVFFCTAQWLQSSFHVVSLQCASYNMRSLDLSWIFCINDGSFMNWRARSPSHGIHCWMIFGSKRRCYGQSLRQAIWCTASCFHTHRVWVSFSRSLPDMWHMCFWERFSGSNASLPFSVPSKLWEVQSSSTPLRPKLHKIPVTSPSRQRIFHVRSESSSRCDALSLKQFWKVRSRFMLASYITQRPETILSTLNDKIQ